MKSRIFKIALIIAGFMIFMQNCSMAATIVSTDKQVESGSGTVTISVTSKQKLGAYTLKLTDTNGLTLVSASGDGQVSADNKTITGSSDKGIISLGSFTFTVPKVTVDTKYNIKFSITGMETPDLETVANETNTAVITVKAPATTGTTATTTTTETPTTKPTETKQEITFTAASGTVYTTVDSLNFRSVSDGSIIGSISAKGTALERTGTASGKVRVKYNGREGYVSSNYVTTTKPEEKKEEEKKEEPKETAKSNNANLKTLVVDGQTLTPVFSANTTSYSLQVGKDVESLEIKAEAEDSKATVTVDGNKSLKEGKNTVAVSVSAEDGTIKIYEIDVQKAQKEEKLGLKSLKIEGTNIFSEFKSSIYSYDIDIEPDVEKLEIEAIANNEEATVEVLGNEDLQEENTITIMVSSKDGTEKVTYQINANKKQKTVVEATEKKGLDSKVYVFIGAGAFVLVALIIVVTYTIKHRNQDDDFYDDEDDFEYEDEQQKTDITSDNTDNFENVQDSDLDDITYRETPRHKRGKHF